MNMDMAALLGIRPVLLRCTNRLRDSLRESSVIAGMHEQFGPDEVRDHERVGSQ
jgi:hypothetical protein